MSKTIAVIVGSLSVKSINRRFAQALIKLAPADVAFEFVEIGDLPLYNYDDDANQAASVKRVKAQIQAADGVLVVTPEYNRSIPAALKNVIDHASRPYGDNTWNNKVGAIIGTSPGGVATALAQNHLRAILSAQGTILMQGPDAFVQFTEGLVTEQGTIGEKSHAYLQGWLNKFLAWVETNAAKA
ncbi:NAD(P)H-dependent oxidoreductase [Lampropedia puyangensis]|uniref:NAD(P)H-dependent oxidoreductase n=1 Tax=Lampropedia puyangensis TaxID=1330072 RepID=A0A4S8EXT1_9BURK|nr:NADPH-dependent FMN reductase [Lampropedia puyangensis]THT99672.1 NAD(P)H-dependent oxidoreductase [Lampropedia puyangensis]